MPKLTQMMEAASQLSEPFFKRKNTASNKLLGIVPTHWTAANYARKFVTPAAWAQRKGYINEHVDTQAQAKAIASNHEFWAKVKYTFSFSSPFDHFSDERSGGIFNDIKFEKFQERINSKGEREKILSESKKLEDKLNAVQIQELQNYLTIHRDDEMKTYFTEFEALSKEFANIINEAKGDISPSDLVDVMQEMKNKALTVISDRQKKELDDIKAKVNEHKNDGTLAESEANAIIERVTANLENEKKKFEETCDANIKSAHDTVKQNNERLYLLHLAMKDARMRKEIEAALRSSGTLTMGRDSGDRAAEPNLADIDFNTLKRLRSASGKTIHLDNGFVSMTIPGSWRLQGITDKIATTITESDIHSLVLAHKVRDKTGKIQIVLDGKNEKELEKLGRLFVKVAAAEGYPVDKDHMQIIIDLPEGQKEYNPEGLFKSHKLSNGKDSKDYSASLGCFIKEAQEIKAKNDAPKQGFGYAKLMEKYKTGVRPPEVRAAAAPPAAPAAPAR